MAPNASRNDGFSTMPMSDVLLDPALMDDLVNWYITVYNAKGPDDWGENWTPEQVHEKIFTGPCARIPTAFLVSWRQSGQLAGAMIASVMPADQAFSHHDFTPGLVDEQVCAGINRAIKWIAGDVPVVHTREVAIPSDFRAGLGPVIRLGADAVEAAINVCGAEFTVGWTNRKSRLFRILVGLDFRVIYNFGDAEGHVVLGDFAKPLLRRMRTPADEAKAAMGERWQQMRMS